MKPKMSSLNPNAASYVPLFQREANNKNNFSELTAEGSLKSGGKNTWSSSPSESDFTRKAEQNLSDRLQKQYVDEDTEMDLAYMATLFPGISEQSLADVYSVNEGDLEASIDMLNELESNPVDDAKHLPDSLDIGDVSECKVTVEGSSMKLKSISSDEASGSASGPSSSAS